MKFYLPEFWTLKLHPFECGYYHQYVLYKSYALYVLFIIVARYIILRLWFRALYDWLRPTLFIHYLFHLRNNICYSPKNVFHKSTCVLRLCQFYRPTSLLSIWQLHSFSFPFSFILQVHSNKCAMRSSTAPLPHLHR